MPEVKTKYKANPLSKKYGHHLHQQKTKKTESVNHLKQQLRSVVRMISKFPEKTDLQESKRSLEQRIHLVTICQKEQLLIEKYKYLKFVESKKIKRRMEKCKEEQEKQELQRDMDYINYYPRDQKYISLFGVDSDKRTQIKEKIREFAEKGMLKEGFMWRMNPVDEETIEAKEQEQDDFFL